MFTKITLKNFKCFKEKTEFPLGQINLLTGTNGRGKSTLLQSLLLMRQSLEYSEFTKQIILNGSCVRLGNFQDIKNSNVSQKEEIIMGYEYEFKNQFSKIEYSLKENKNDEMTAKIDCISLSNIINSEETKTQKYSVDKFDKSVILLQSLTLSKSSFPKGDFDKLTASFKKIYYISADRIGPQDFYYRTYLTNFPNVGAKGENTINLLSKQGDESVYPKLCLGENAQTLSTQTEEWLNYIFDGAKLEIPKSSMTVIEPLFNTTLSRDRFKASNIGFGYSYILPIIVSGLIAKAGEILIVENPEAHLHPKAQSRLTKFLAKVSQLGVQIFIE